MVGPPRRNEAIAECSRGGSNPLTPTKLNQTRIKTFNRNVGGFFVIKWSHLNANIMSAGDPFGDLEVLKVR